MVLLAISDRKLRILITGMITVLGLTFPAHGETAPVCAQHLDRLFDPWLQEPALRGATVGIAVETLEGEVLYHYQADRRLVPASNQKLITTAVALDRLGADRRWQTTVDLSTDPQGGWDLWLTGQGDPSFTYASLDQLAQETATELHRKGIDRIAHVVADDRFLGLPDPPPTWEVEDTQTGYGAPISALILTENAIPLTLWPQAVGQPLRLTWETPQDQGLWKVENYSTSGDATAAEFVNVTAREQPGGDSQGRSLLRIEGVLRSGSDPEPVGVAVPNPSQRFLSEFQHALNQHGITSEQTRALEWPDTTQAQAPQTLVTWPSPPLRNIVTIANQQSQNLYAEVLLRWLGKTNPQPAPGAAPSLTTDGIALLNTVLPQWGIAADAVTIADGSGLSRHNQITPEAIVQVLRHSAHAPWGATYRSSLSEAGVSGTLAHRFVQTPLAHKLWAKTGSMEGIMALSGYLNPDQFTPLSFSIVVNNSQDSYGNLANTLDALLLQLVNLRTCTP